MLEQHQLPYKKKNVLAEMKDVSQNTISKKLRRITRQLTGMYRNAV